MRIIWTNKATRDEIKRLEGLNDYLNEQNVALASRYEAVIILLNENNRAYVNMANRLSKLSDVMRDAAKTVGEAKEFADCLAREVV